MQPEDIDSEARRILALYVEAGYPEAPQAADPLSQLVSGLAGDDTTRVVSVLCEELVGRQALAVALMQWADEYRRWQEAATVEVKVELDRDDGDVVYRAGTKDEHLMAVSSSILRVVGGLGMEAVRNYGPDVPVRVRFDMSVDVLKRINQTNDA